MNRERRGPSGLLILKTADQWRFEIPPGVTARVLIDWAVTVQVLVPGGAIEVRIEKPIVITDATGSTEVNPEGDPRLLGPALAVARSAVESVTAFMDGRLEIVFEGAVVWRVSPSPRFEAWTINSPDGVLLVGLPGGSVATWGLSDR
jgi:hypothetical protein